MASKSISLNLLEIVSSVTFANPQKQRTLSPSIIWRYTHTYLQRL